MSAISKRRLLSILPGVIAEVTGEISGTASRGKLASALSTEGYAGGYADALRDVEAFLLHGYPSDTRGYWRLALTAPSGKEGG